MGSTRFCIGGVLRNPSSKAVWGAVLTLALYWPVAATASTGRSKKLDKAVEASSSSGEAVDVIIRAKAGRAAAVKSKVGRRASDVHVHGVINAVSARLSARDI